jgi:steroid delta-isomerase-like uncharacterized protein
MADAAGLHREMFEVIASRDLTRLTELYHPDYAYASGSGEEGGVEAGLQVAETYTKAFPDMTFTVENEFSCGDNSVLEITVRGTQTGDLPDIPATGRAVEMRLCNIVEVRDGKIYRERDYFDTLTMLQQLGVLPES